MNFTDKDLRLWNRDLRELDEIKQDLAKASQAGVPQIEELIATCNQCEQRIHRLKATYFPNKA